eukprot:gene23085-30278_t
MAKRSNDMCARDISLKPSRRSAYFKQWQSLQADLLDITKRDGCLVYRLLPGETKDGPLQFEPLQGGSTAVMPLLAFTPTHVSEELSNRPALIVSGPKAVQPLDSNERHVSEAPNNSPEEDASGSGDGMPRDEMQGQNKAVMSLLGGKTSHSMLPKAHPNAVAKVAPHKQPPPPIPGRSAFEKKKFKPPAQASGAERHSQPPPIEDDSNGEGQKGKRT